MRWWLRYGCSKPHVRWWELIQPTVKDAARRRWFCAGARCRLPGLHPWGLAGALAAGPGLFPARLRRSSACACACAAAWTTAHIRHTELEGVTITTAPLTNRWLLIIFVALFFFPPEECRIGISSNRTIRPFTASHPTHSQRHSEPNTAFCHRPRGAGSWGQHSNLCAFPGAQSILHFIRLHEYYT